MLGLSVARQSDDLHHRPGIAFRVDDFDAARRALLAAGVKFIGDVQHADGVSWQHFHAPDGTVLEISG